MKNVLIPTDFSIKSLKLAGAAVKRFEGEKLNIILVHALQPDHSISALLLMHKRHTMNRLQHEEFMEACEIVKNKYNSSINSLKVEFYNGSSRAYLNNFLDARNVDAVVLATDYELNLEPGTSIDLKPMLEKTKCTIYYETIMKAGQKIVFEEPSISELLHA